MWILKGLFCWPFHQFQHEALTLGTTIGHLSKSEFCYPARPDLKILTMAVFVGAFVPSSNGIQATAAFAHQETKKVICSILSNVCVCVCSCVCVWHVRNTVWMSIIFEVLHIHFGVGGSVSDLVDERWNYRNDHYYLCWHQGECVCVRMCVFRFGSGFWYQSISLWCWERKKFW